MSALRHFSGESLLDRSTVVLGTLGLLVLWYIFSSCYYALSSPLRRLPGPLVTRFSRIWEFYRAICGDINLQTIDLHERHGGLFALAT